MRKITISNWLANLLLTNCPDERVEIVANSVDTRLFRAQARERNAIPTVGFVYSESWFRGIDIVLRAIDQARSEVTDLRVVAFGHEAPKTKLDLTYWKNPPQEDISEIYGQCDAWLFGSRMEGFGLPILEAMACRTPVIAAPAGAAPELLDRGGGLLVKAEDPADMAAAIVKISRLTPRRWKALSDAAHANATRYSWDDATTLFENALRGAVGNSTRHAETRVVASHH